MAYTKKAYAYVRSEKFKKDTRRSAEFIGETVGSTSSGISDGLSSTVDEKAIDKLASKSAIIFGKVIKTFA